jgi:ribosomal protein L14
VGIYGALALPLSENGSHTTSFSPAKNDWSQKHPKCNVSRVHLCEPPKTQPKKIKKVIDNSGAMLVECVNVLKNKVNNGWGSVGDEIVCIVKRARPMSSGPGTGSGAGAQAVSNALKVRRGDVRRAVIVRCRKSVRRPDGRLVRFDDNAAVLLNNKREMLGTRIGGVVSADLRMKGWGKIVSLAPKVSNDYPHTPVAILGKWVVKAVGR